MGGLNDKEINHTYVKVKLFHFNLKCIANALNES
jgi:hypothetical protein